MGKHITLICDETPELKLGPGEGRNPTPGSLLVFSVGYVDFDEDDYPDWEAWVAAPGTPHIEVVDTKDERVSAAATLGFDCPDCEKSFKSKSALNAHRLSHRKK
jgi:hypothetical protein